MADISIIEFIVYGFISYASILMLIISTITEIPLTKAQSILRVIYLIPGMITSGILANASTIVYTANTITALNTTEVWTEAEQFVLQSEIWTLVHVMIFLVLFVHVMIQVLSLLTKTE